MAAYGRRSTRATKKKRKISGKSKREREKKKRKTAKAKVAGKAPKAAKKRAKRAKPKKAAAKPKKAAKRAKPKKAAAKRAKPKKAAAAKKPAKKAAAKKPAKKPAAAKKPAKKAAAKKPTLRERLAAERSKNREQAQRIKELVQTQKKAKTEKGREFKARLKTKIVQERWKEALAHAPEVGIAPTTDAVAKDLRRRFQTLFDHARRTNQFPRPGRLRTTLGRTSQYVGVQKKISVRRLLRSMNDVYFIRDKVDVAGRTLSQTYPLWNGSVAISAMGQGLPGSSQKLIDVTGLGPSTGHSPEDLAAARFFEVAAYHAVGVSHTLLGYLMRLQDLLEEFTATPNTQVYVHYVVVRTFRPKNAADK